MEPETVLPSCCISSRLPLRFSAPRSSSQSVPAKTAHVQRQASEPALRIKSLSSFKNVSKNEGNQDALPSSGAVIRPSAIYDDFSYPKSSLRKLSLQERRKIFEINSTGDHTPELCSESISQEGQHTEYPLSIRNFDSVHKPQTKAGISMTYEAATSQNQMAAGRQDLIAKTLVSCTPDAKIMGSEWKQTKKFDSGQKTCLARSKMQQFSRGTGTMDVRQRICSFESLASQRQPLHIPAISHEKKSTFLLSCSSPSVKTVCTDEANQHTVRQRSPLACNSSDQQHNLVGERGDKVSMINNLTKQETLGKTEESHVTSENKPAAHALQGNGCEQTELSASTITHHMTSTLGNDQTEVLGGCIMFSEKVASEKSDTVMSEKKDIKSESVAEMAVLGSANANYSECCKAAYISDTSKVEQNDSEKIKSEVTDQISHVAEMCSYHSSQEKETARDFLDQEDVSEILFEPSFTPKQRSSSPVPEDEFASESSSEENSLKVCEGTSQLPSAMMDLSSPLAPRILLDCYDDKHDSDGSVVTTPSDLSQMDMKSFSISLAELRDYSAEGKDDYLSEGLLNRSASLNSNLSAFSMISLIPAEDLEKMMEEVKSLGDETYQHLEDIQVIILHKEEGTGLGFSIAGGVDQNKKVTVHKVFPNGLAAQEGTIQQGDELLSINGNSLNGATHSEALHILHRARPSRQAIIVVQKANESEKHASPPPSSSTKSPSFSVESSQFPVLSEPSDLVTVELIKDSNGLGFSLEGGKESIQGDRPLTVQKVFLGGPVELIQPGDELVQIEDRNIQDLMRLEAWNIIKTLPAGPVKVTIKKKKKP